MGNTAILLNALESRSIDVYPEYTGTIAREILKLPDVPPLAELNTRLAQRGLAVAVPLGFNNSYALAVRSSVAKEKSLARISDLKQHPELRLGLSQEFLGRADGWPNLQRTYGLRFPPPKGLDHGLAYEAIAGGQVDVIDIYTTDAKLDKYQLTVLEDDLGFFPRYDAVLLYRSDVPARFPKAWAALAQLEGKLDDAAMRRLNAAAELDGKDIAAVATDWLSAPPGQLRLDVRVGLRDAADALATTLRARPGTACARTHWTRVCSAGGELCDRHPAGLAGCAAPADRAGRLWCDRGHPDDSGAGASGISDPDDRTHRSGAGVHRAHSVCAPADRAQHPGWTDPDPTRNDRSGGVPRASTRDHHAED